MKILKSMCYGWAGAVLAGTDRLPIAEGEPSTAGVVGEAIGRELVSIVGQAGAVLDGAGQPQERIEPHRVLGGGQPGARDRHFHPTRGGVVGDRQLQALAPSVHGHCLLIDERLAKCDPLGTHGYAGKIAGERAPHGKAPVVPGAHSRA